MKVHMNSAVENMMALVSHRL
ncbi:hypothetical protein Ahy_A02g005830 isoform B [Arachis hypogaea]|uniref:Uncharacterized protein n=1 Tax=Arachis hypogaea TaxID=3818 RepID=A0A445E7Y7_ARAHY|nr:hypothetical protein Ahy_A02g005830 isoform B [Arachis hypogaea]